LPLSAALRLYNLSIATKNIVFQKSQMHYLSHLNCLECDTETQVFTKNRLWINSTASLCNTEVVWKLL
jgi:hypothetical protein